MTYVYVMCDHAAAPPVAREKKRLCADGDSDDLLTLYRMSLVELRERYIFKSGEVWTLPVSGIKILIREHDERLFALMCYDMNLGRVGFRRPSTKSKALLAGSPGMGKSTFMWVAAITFMKMVKADPSEEHIQHVYLLQRDGRTKLKVAVFNPHVSGLRIRWTKLAGAEMVYLGHEPHSMDYLRTVRLFNAGANLVQLPCAQTRAFVFATSPAHPFHHDQWTNEDTIQPRYIMPWTWEEVKALARVVGKPEVECFQQFELIGGNPRGVFELSMDGLRKALGQHMTRLAECDFAKLDQMLRVNRLHDLLRRKTPTYWPPFSLVQMRPRHNTDTINDIGDFRRCSVSATRAAWRVSITTHDYAVCWLVYQLKFASRTIYHWIDTNYAAKIALIDKIRALVPRVGDQFEDFVHSVISRQGFAGRDILFMERCAVLNDMATVKRAPVTN